jgi:hypothetical protein
MTSRATTEADLPVADLLRWMTRADPNQLRDLLIGCALDDGTSDDLIPIAGVAIADRVLVLTGGRRISLRTVLHGLRGVAHSGRTAGNRRTGGTATPQRGPRPAGIPG